MELIQFAEQILKWVIVPVAGFIWVIYTRQQDHHTDIEVLKANVGNNKQAHDRELASISETTNKIFAKLNSIEEALRK